MIAETRILKKEIVSYWDIVYWRNRGVVICIKYDTCFEEIDLTNVKNTRVTTSEIRNKIYSKILLIVYAVGEDILEFTERNFRDYLLMLKELHSQC